MAMSRRMWENQQERKRQERLRRARLRRNCTLAVIAAIAAIVVIIAGVKNSGVNEINLAEQANAGQTADIAPAQTITPAVPTAAAESDIKLSDTYYKNAVFIGGALADGIGMYSLLPDCGVYARVGLEIDKVYSTAADNDTIAVIDQLKSKKYSKVFLAFGEMEMMNGNISDFKKSYEKLIETVKDYQSGASIYLMAIPPISETASQRFAITQTTVKSFNTAIRSLAYSMSVYYSDGYTALAGKDGFLPEGVSSDGINLNKASYLTMLDYITKHSLIPGDPDDEDAEDVYDKDTDEDDNKDSDKDYEDDEEEDYGSSAPTPKPTTNVLKDSHTSSSSKSSSSKASDN